MLPWSYWEDVLGPLSMNFSTWIASGLMIVIGAVWAIVFNADLLLGIAMRVLGRIRRLAPVLKMSMAYPLANRFRTGTTLAMFTLVVFTLVTGMASNGSFLHAMENTETFGGGFDVRASAGGGTPIADVQRAVSQTPGLDADDFTVAAAQSFLPIEAAQVGTGRALEPYVVRGLDASFLGHTTFDFAKIAEGYGSEREVWSALAARPGLAVIDSTVAPRRDNFGFAPPTDFKLSGFLLDEGPMQPIDVLVRDPQTEKDVTVTIIGILSESTPLEMAGMATSQKTLAGAFPGRAYPTIFYFDLAPGVDAASGGHAAGIGLPRQRHGGGVRRAGHARRHRCRESRSTGSSRASWGSAFWSASRPSASSARARSSSAASRSGSCAPSASAEEWSRPRSCSSPRSSR